MKSSHGTKPTGPHSTRTAMSDLVNPKAWTAEFWMGPQKFHTIPCIKASRENSVSTSHLLPYTLLFTGWMFASGWEGARRGSRSASVLEPAPIVAAFLVSISLEKDPIERSACQRETDAFSPGFSQLHKTKTAVSSPFCHFTLLRMPGRKRLGSLKLSPHEPPSWLLRSIGLTEAVAAVAEPKWSSFTVTRSRCKQKPCTGHVSFVYFRLCFDYTCSARWVPRVMFPPRFPRSCWLSWDICTNKGWLIADRLTVWTHLSRMFAKFSRSLKAIKTKLLLP